MVEMVPDWLHAVVWIVAALVSLTIAGVTATQRPLGAERFTRIVLLLWLVAGYLVAATAVIACKLSGADRPEVMYVSAAGAFWTAIIFAIAPWVRRLSTRWYARRSVGPEDYAEDHEGNPVDSAEPRHS
jgi:hypothetical protein